MERNLSENDKRSRLRLDNNNKRLSHWNGRDSDMGQPFLKVLDITKSRIVKYF